SPEVPIEEFFFDGSDTAPFIRAWVTSTSFVVCLDHVRVAIASLDEFIIMYGEKTLQDLLFPGGGFNLGIAVIPLIIAVKEALRNYSASTATATTTHSDLTPDVLLHFVAQTRAQITTAAKVLRMMTRGNEDSSMKRGVAAARLIERLLDDVTNPVSRPESSRLVDWVAGESTGILWRMIQVGSGAAEPQHLVAANVGCSDVDGTGMVSVSDSDGIGNGNPRSVSEAVSTRFVEPALRWNTEGIVDIGLDVIQRHLMR
ncbi:hypothetical protein HDU93_002594, partial [Gonapodya sp. JEL0774]